LVKIPGDKRLGGISVWFYLGRGLHKKTIGMGKNEKGRRKRLGGKSEKRGAEVRGQTIDKVVGGG